jgi:hypothetical protein
MAKHRRTGCPHFAFKGRIARASCSRASLIRESDSDARYSYSIRILYSAYKELLLRKPLNVQHIKLSTKLVLVITKLIPRDPYASFCCMRSHGTQLSLEGEQRPCFEARV